MRGVGRTARPCPLVLFAFVLPQTNGDGWGNKRATFNVHQQRTCHTVYAAGDGTAALAVLLPGEAGRQRGGPDLPETVRARHWHVCPLYI